MSEIDPKNFSIEEKKAFERGRREAEKGYGGFAAYQDQKRFDAYRAGWESIKFAKPGTSSASEKRNPSGPDLAYTTLTIAAMNTLIMRCTASVIIPIVASVAFREGIEGNMNPHLPHNPHVQLYTSSRDVMFAVTSASAAPSNVIAVWNG